jgi:hypothetical protein
MKRNAHPGKVSGITEFVFASRGAGAAAALPEQAKSPLLRRRLALVQNGVLADDAPNKKLKGAPQWLLCV